MFNPRLPETAAQALRIVAKSTFREFTERDFNTFLGCDSDKPLIYETEKIAIIIDGNVIDFHDYLYSADEVVNGKGIDYDAFISFSVND